MFQADAINRINIPNVAELPGGAMPDADDFNNLVRALNRLKNAWQDLPRACNDNI